MAESKTIKKYRTEIIDNVIVEIPVRDEESKDIIELNFKQYIDVLADIVVRYASNFKTGQAVGLHLCLLLKTVWLTLSGFKYTYIKVCPIGQLF